MEFNNLRKKYNKKFLLGFTLVEILIVMSIILILLVVIFSGYSAGRKGLALQRSAHKLAQDLRRAQEMAMSAAEFREKVPGGGYGIYFTPDNNERYYLYADTSPIPYGDQEYTPGEDAGPIEIIILEKDIYISDIPQNSLSINFSPPDPTTTITGTGDGTEATITLCIKGSNCLGQTKKVKVNKSGLIYIEPLSSVTPTQTPTPTSYTHSNAHSNSDANVYSQLAYRI